VGDTADDLDLKIISLLRHNGRTSNRELARLLGYSEATIRRRVSALIERGQIKIAAIANPYRLGYTMDVIMGVEVAPGMLKEAAEQFAAIENVRSVTITTGAYDLIIAAMFRSNDEYLEFLSTDVRQISGLARIHAANSLSVVKRSYDFFPESQL
jgi:Lrp/AsnC family transcriptional regulator for asnA, asnC and gidA